MVKFLIGIDEAGRGPLAGPVSVGIIVAPKNYDISKNFPGVDDSKKLSEKKREEIYTKLEEKCSEVEPRIQFLVLFASAGIIDSKGITYAVRHCINKGVRSLAPKCRDYHVLLDGLLHAPIEYTQKTIIGGDALEPIISLASIAAKVERDRLMKRLSKKYPNYGFEQHKGYGTKAHKEAITTLGLCKIHRKTYGANMWII